MSITERAERLAANLLADRERERPKHNIVACWSCGTTYVYRGRQGELNGNFCSMRCQEWFDGTTQPMSSNANTNGSCSSIRSQIWWWSLVRPALSAGSPMPSYSPR
jgi:endogenous inhibitor of DNA gyrase (YacG/DUF329 family)